MNYGVIIQSGLWRDNPEWSDNLNPEWIPQRNDNRKWIHHLELLKKPWANISIAPKSVHIDDDLHEDGTEFTEQYLVPYVVSLVCARRSPHSHSLSCHIYSVVHCVPICLPVGGPGPAG